MKKGLSVFLIVALMVFPAQMACAQSAISQIFQEIKAAMEESGAMEAEEKVYTSSVTREEALEVLYDYPSMDFTLQTLDGESITLSELQGKIVVLSIWASWCGPCKGEMPIFEEVNNKYEDIVVLAVHSVPYETGVEHPGEKDIQEAEAVCRAFVEENGFTFPVLLDTTGEVSLSNTYITRGIPGNFVIDKEGIIRYGQEGAYANEESLMMVIDYVRALG